MDDSPANLLAYSVVLEPLGYEIVTATSGIEAVRLLAGHQFALLLIDVRMPGMDGLETVELLRTQLRRATPVVFVTGEEDDSAMRRAYAFGAVDYLVKPIDADVLRGKVRNLISLYEQGLELERQAALLIEQQQKLMDADAEVRRQDTNIGILAHDLRNPLNAIVMGTNSLRRLPQLPESAQRTVERIQRSARRMTLMIRDIMEFTRGRVGGKIPLSRQRVDLVAICRSITDEVRSAHSTAEIDVHAIGEQMGSWDQARIEQALSNLISNAVEHGSGTATLSISGSEPDPVIVEVRNGGEPIPPEHLPALFEPFRKGGQNQAGLGLGLYIVREIVRAHAGTIQVTSSSEETIFRMTLPRNVASDSGEHVVRSGDRPGPIGSPGYGSPA